MEEDELLVERKSWPVANREPSPEISPAMLALLKDLAPFLGDLHASKARSAAVILAKPAAARHPRYLRWRRRPGRGRNCVSFLSSRRAIIQELEELDRSAQEKLRLKDLVVFPAQ